MEIDIEGCVTTVVYQLNDVQNTMHMVRCLKHREKQLLCLRTRLADAIERCSQQQADLDESLRLLMTSYELNSLLKSEYNRLLVLNNYAHPAQWEIPPPRGFDLPKPPPFTSAAGSFSVAVNDAASRVVKAFKQYHKVPNISTKLTVERYKKLRMKLNLQLPMLDSAKQEMEQLQSVILGLQKHNNSLQATIYSVLREPVTSLLEYRDVARARFICLFENTDSIFSEAGDITVTYRNGSSTAKSLDNINQTCN